MGKRIAPPTCQHCPDDVPAELVDGQKIYPRIQTLWEKPYWRCPDCGAYCGCHPGTKRPLGRPANKELRNARQRLHNERFDPIWRTAVTTGEYNPEGPKAAKIIANAARSRTYAWLAEKLEIDRAKCHIAMFDLETCRRAWSALFQIGYPEIRDWWKAREAAKPAAPEQQDAS